MMTNVTTVAEHQPCPDCGSHDALAVYSDGHTYCFSCEAYHGGGLALSRPKAKPKAGMVDTNTMQIGPLKKRLIGADACTKYGYFQGLVDGQPAQVANYINDDGTITGQKIRYPDKVFTCRGSMGDRFFGQHLWQGGGQKLVITEGEIDCLSVYQVLGNNTPVVSLPNGCKSARKVFGCQYDWLDKFQEIILMFDMDAPGRAAIKDVVGLLEPGKVKVAYLPYKDANECLQQGKAAAIMEGVWQAKVYKPACIINGNELWDSIATEDTQEQYPLPWEKLPLQSMTQGVRRGELIMITAGTGVGKTTFVRQLAHHFGVGLGLKTGMIMLEESAKRTALGLLSLHLGKRISVNRSLASMTEIKHAYDTVFGTGNYVLYDHFGSLAADDLIRTMRYMILAEGCQFVILDHISIAISGLEISDERKAIDVMMTRLRSLVEETGVGMLVVSHLRRTEGTPAEEGGAISLSMLRGSQASAQLSDGVWALERNQQAEDLEERNLVRVRVLKNRYTGETGLAGYLKYDKDTDRLIDGTNIHKQKDKEEKTVRFDEPTDDIPF